jgi:hypothetical protein
MVLVELLQHKRDCHRITAAQRQTAAENLLVTTRPYLGEELENILQ